MHLFAGLFFILFCLGLFGAWDVVFRLGFGFGVLVLLVSWGGGVGLGFVGFLGFWVGFGLGRGSFLGFCCFVGQEAVFVCLFFGCCLGGFLFTWDT